MFSAESKAAIPDLDDIPALLSASARDLQNAGPRAMPQPQARLALQLTTQARSENWCRALDRPAYDCLYLALAEMRSAVLITQDQRLLKKLESLPNAAGLAMAIEATSSVVMPAGLARMILRLAGSPPARAAL